MARTLSGIVVYKNVCKNFMLELKRNLKKADDEIKEVRFWEL